MKVWAKRKVKQIALEYMLYSIRYQLPPSANLSSPSEALVSEVRKVDVGERMMKTMGYSLLRDILAQVPYGDKGDDAILTIQLESKQMKSPAS